MAEKEKGTSGLRLFTDEQFSLVERLCAAPSPIGFEAAMVNEVVLPEFKKFMPKSWGVHRFVGNPGVVIDTAPENQEALSVMIIGHADKIRLQVRSIGDDGKIWVNTDSFLPAAILGHKFVLFVEEPEKLGRYKTLHNLTAQAFGAVHFVDDDVSSGKKGVEPKHIYLETGLFGKDRKKRLEEYGVRPGQVAIFSRTVERGSTPGTFLGPYLDNALGCFCVIEVARGLAKDLEKGGVLKGVRVLFTIASHEELGYFGSRIAAGVFKPNIVIAVDVDHDYEAAPGIGDRREHPSAMGKGVTISSGTVHSYRLVSFVQDVAKQNDIPFQYDFCGYESGTDSMAGVMSAIDAASLSVGFPIRNMHTSSELAHDGDVLAAVDLLSALVRRFAVEEWSAEQLKEEHVVLDRNAKSTALPLSLAKKKEPEEKESSD